MIIAASAYGFRCRLLSLLVVDIRHEVLADSLGILLD